MPLICPSRYVHPTGVNVKDRSAFNLAHTEQQNKHLRYVKYHTRGYENDTILTIDTMFVSSICVAR